MLESNEFISFLEKFGYSRGGSRFIPEINLFEP
jgi:hypothetical protein